MIVEFMDPAWWERVGSMKGFSVNVLKFGNDNSYGEDSGYGRGCWGFYNKTTQTLRVFRWSQQHLSNRSFKEKFNLIDES